MVKTKLFEAESRGLKRGPQDTIWPPVFGVSGKASPSL